MQLGVGAGTVGRVGERDHRRRERNRRQATAGAAQTGLLRRLLGAVPRPGAFLVTATVVTILLQSALGGALADGFLHPLFDHRRHLGRRRLWRRTLVRRIEEGALLGFDQRAGVLHAGERV